MTLAENVGLPLTQSAALSPEGAREVARLKLALVGLAGFEDHYPSEISGGMRKRAGLARAMALDPEILYFDEPSAGLDPLSSRRLDDLILELRDSAGTTIVLVTHELPSIFELGDHAVFLDAERKTMIAQGTPDELKDCPERQGAGRSCGGSGCERQGSPARDRRLRARSGGPGAGGHRPLQRRGLVRPPGSLHRLFPGLREGPEQRGHRHVPWHQGRRGRGREGGAHGPAGSR